MSYLHVAGTSRLHLTLLNTYSLALLPLGFCGTAFSQFSLYCLFSGFCLLSVSAVVFLQSFLTLNLTLEIFCMFFWGILILHLFMTPKCVLLALTSLKFHSLYIWMSHWHLKPIIFKSCIYLLSSNHPTTDPPFSA